MFSYCITLSVVLTAVTSEKILYAVNFGGKTFNGSDGVVYKSNTDYGSVYFPKNLTNVPEHDLFLYQTASPSSTYPHQTIMEVQLPIAGNGFYNLTLKFPSLDNVYYTDVALNGLRVLEQFNAVANETNDHIVSFEVYNHELIWDDQYTEVRYNGVPIRFINGPWISAMKLAYTPSPRPEALLQGIRDDFKKLFDLLAKKKMSDSVAEE